MKADTNDPARAALLAFLRRTFTQLAVASEKDAKAFRAVLKELAS